MCPRENVYSPPHFEKTSGTFSKFGAPIFWNVKLT
jgi:hypothetical protein